MTNEERAQRGKKCLLVYEACQEDDPTSSIVDLVTDLLHLAHAHDIEPDYVTQTAQTHYQAEVEKEAGL